MASTHFVAEPRVPQVVITREFDAPREFLFRAYTDPYETRFDMAQISPRVFEAAALRTPMVLYTGGYSGLIEPGEHYIELKKDFSNVDAVLDRLSDTAGLEQMAERAYCRLVGSGEFSYARFIQLIGDTIDRRAAELGLALRPAAEIAASGATAEAASHLRELPTRVPNDPVVFLYKFYSAEIARLNRVISDLHGRLTAPAPPQVAAVQQLRQLLPDWVVWVLRKLVRPLARWPGRTSGAP